MLAAIDNWLFLLFIAGAGLLKLLTKAANSKSTSNQPDDSTFPKPDAERPGPVSDQEQIRKFLEALGQPRTAKPPPPLQPRTDVAARPLAPVSPPKSMLPLPQLPKKRPPVERTSSPPPIPRRSYQPTQMPATRAAVPGFEVQETRAVQLASTLPVAPGADPTPAAAQQPADLMSLLRSPNGLRQAIILREIFGAPRSLQSLEDLPGTA